MQHFKLWKQKGLCVLHTRMLTVMLRKTQEEKESICKLLENNSDKKQPIQTCQEQIMSNHSNFLL